MIGQRACDEELDLFDRQILGFCNVDGAVAFIVKIIGKERLEVCHNTGLTMDVERNSALLGTAEPDRRA